MPDAVKNCPKCQTAMQPGYVQDSGYGRVFQAPWISGTPKEARLLGIKNGITYRQDGLPMVAHRCPKCTLVEWYAPEAGAA